MFWINEEIDGRQIGKPPKHDTWGSLEKRKDETGGGADATDLSILVQAWTGAWWRSMVWYDRAVFQVATNVYSPIW